MAALSEENKKLIAQLTAQSQQVQTQKAQYDAKVSQANAVYAKQKDVQSAQIASNTDNTLIGKATTGTTMPVVVPRPGNVADSLFKTPNYVSNFAMSGIEGIEAAEQRKAALEKALNDLYQQMEGYKNNGQTEELARAEQRYKLLGDNLDRIRAYDSSLTQAEKWEAEQRDQIFRAGGADLMYELKELADLKAAVDVEEKANMGSEILKAPSKAWYEYQRRVATLKAQYGDDAMNWLAFAERASNRVSSEHFAEDMRQAGKDSPLWTILPRVAVNKIGGLGALDVAVQKAQKAITGSDIPIDYNRTAQLPAKMAASIQQGGSERIAEGWSGEFGSFLYNIGLSMADSYTARGSGDWGTALLGGSAATNAMQGAIQRGATDEQALGLGIVVGSVEAVMEKLSIDSLFALKDPKTAADFFMNVFKQSSAEGAEEGLTRLANDFADYVVMGDKSELNTAKRAYMADGNSPEKAEAMALKDWGLGLLTDIAGGMLSGGVFASFKTGSDVVRNGGFQKPTVESVMPKMQQEAQATGNDQVARAVQSMTGQNKNAPVNGTETESTSVNTDPANHTRVEQRVIDEFQNSVDDGLVAFARDTLSGNGSNMAKNQRYQLSPVSDRAASDILRETNVNTSGFSTAIERRAIEHINLRHGKNGNTDQSMQDLNDLGRIQYVLDNYDSVSAGGNSSAYTTIKPNGKPGQAKTVVFEKAVNGTYYVVEAVPDTKAKTTFVVSAYMSQNGAKKPKAEQTADTASSPDVYVQNENARASGDSSIPNPKETVNGVNPAMGAADYGFDPISNASNKYGAIPPGEKASRVVDVPVSMDGKTRVSQYARTGAEASATNEEMAQRIMDLVAENKLSHEIFTDDAALEAAGEKIAEAYQSGNGYNVYTQFLQDVAAGKAGKDLMATGSLLYADAAANGDYDSASELFVALTDLQTRAGQTVQAARLLKKLSPEGRVWVVNKIVGKIQNEINQGRKPDKQIKIKVDDALIDAFKNAKTPKAQAEAMDNIYKAVAEQMPTTIGDAVNEFRYFMMLSNVSTHLKNLSGNFGQTIMVALKDTIATAIETGVDAASKAFGGKGIQRTKAFLNLASESDRALMGAAWADYENVQDDIAGAGKYKDSARYQVSKYQSYWKLNNPKTKAGELVSRGLQMVEKAPQANSELMNMEDRWFSQPNYAVALAGYMKANNLTEPNDAAREYAVKEAQKATFRDLNAVSKWAKSLGKTKFTKFLVDSVFPFKATPANVGVRAMEYSPAGLAVTLGKAAVAVKKGEFNAAQFIDDLSANATGSLLAGLGYLLAQSGVLRVTGIGDDKEKQQQALEGHKNNSIYNVPIEFVSPAAATLLLGGAIYEAKATKELDGRSYGASDSLNALSGITDPILETTMLDGLRGILSTVRSSGGKVDGKLLADIGIQIVGNYIGSFMSSQLSRVYAATDDATRTTYVDKTKDDTIANLPNVQKLVQGLQYKSPHRTGMVQDIDAWGRPIEGNKGSGGTDFENFMESLFNVITPTYPGKAQETAVDKELKRLYRAEGVDNSKVSLFMKDAAKDFTVDGKTVYLTGDQWEQYQMDRGQGAMTMRENLLSSNAYQSLSDGVKAVAMDIALEYANDLAKEKLDVGFKIDDGWMKDLAGADDETITDAIISRAIYREAGRIDEAENDEEKTRQDYFIDMLNDLDINRSEKRKRWIDAGYAESTCPW